MPSGQPSSPPTKIPIEDLLVEANRLLNEYLTDTPSKDRPPGVTGQISQATGYIETALETQEILIYIRDINEASKALNCATIPILDFYVGPCAIYALVLERSAQEIEPIATATTPPTNAPTNLLVL